MTTTGPSGFLELVRSKAQAGGDRILLSPGWRSLHEGDTRPGKAHLRDGMDLFERFEICAFEDDGGVVVLGYVVEDGRPALRHVSSEVLDVPDALDKLRAEWGSILRVLRAGIGWYAVPEAAELARPGGPDAQLAAARKAAEQVMRTPLANRRNRITREHLEEVATVYRSAVDRGEWPTAAVSKHFDNAPRSTVSKWIKRAREEGLDLPPATEVSR